MKKLITYTLASLLLIVSCRKGDNPRLPALSQVPAPLITVDPTGDATINVSTPASADAFNGKFKVNLYFPNGAKPAKFDIVVEKNGDPAQVKPLTAGVTTFPTTLAVTGVQLRTLFNANLVLGDQFTIGANVTTADGKVYPAFPAVGAAYDAGILSAPGFSPTAAFTAVCKFDITAFGAIGSTVQMQVVRDDWQDYFPPQTIPVTIIDATHFSFMYAATNPKPIVIAVDPNTNATSVASVAYGSYGGEVWTATSVPGNKNNVVLPCALSLSVDLDQKGAINGDQGGFVIALKIP